MTKSIVQITLLTLVITTLISCSDNIVSNGRLSGSVVSAGTGASVPNATVTISDILLESVTDNAGRFTILEIPEGSFTISASADLYLTKYVPGIDIYNNETTRLEIILPRLGITGSVTGQIRDATDGTPVKGASITFLGGARSATSGDDGHFTLDGVPEGPQIIQVKAEGYFKISSPEIEIVEDETSPVDFLLSPGFQNGEQFRVVLSWAEFPLDLDSHLKTPVVGESALHVWYAGRGSSTEAPYAELDIDDTNGFGPETITFYEAYPGYYYYYVHNYTQSRQGDELIPSDDLTVSEAVVQVYDEDGARERFTVPTSGDGLYWYVFALDLQRLSVIPANVIQDEAPGPAIADDSPPRPTGDKTLPRADI